MDENLNSVSATQTPISNPEIDEAQALSELKAQISELKAQNANLQEAKAKYYDTVLNGQTPTQSVEPEHRAVKDIRDDLIKGMEKGITNLDYCTLALELDDAVREDAAKRNHRDSVFLPKGRQVQITVDEYATADKMHDVLKECIDNAKGDPDRFNAELNAHMPKY